MAVPLDTYEVVKALTGAGFTAEQAEVVTRVVRDARADDFAALATKADLAATKADLERGMAATKADLERSIAALRSDLELRLARTDATLELRLSEVRTSTERLRGELVRWVLGTGIAAVLSIAGLVAAMVRFLPR